MSHFLSGVLWFLLGYSLTRFVGEAYQRLRLRNRRRTAERRFLQALREQRMLILPAEAKDEDAQAAAIRLMFLMRQL